MAVASPLLLTGLPTILPSPQVVSQHRDSPLERELVRQLMLIQRYKCVSTGSEKRHMHDLGDSRLQLKRWP
jgi:hypothetical protein